MKSFVIAISGGCNSGKTTFINKLQELAPHDILVSDEIIRETNIESIDGIRKDPDKYFEFEKKVIHEKFLKDRDSSKIEDKICLLDRSLIDSYFYYTYYLDPSKLNRANQDEYPTFKQRILDAIEISYRNVYDKIIFFESIPVNTPDKFRPQNIETQKEIESKTILKLFDEFIPNPPIEHFKVGKDDIPRFISAVLKQDLNSLIFKNYEEYKNLVEDKLFTFTNILMNTYGTIDYVGQSKQEMFTSGLLYSVDKETTDTIIQWIKAINIEPEYMNSRCYPTGICSINGVMVVGEAPGQYGRSIKPTYLKPSFVYAKPSWILRQCLLDCFEVDYAKAPYITNLLKYARKDNKVVSEDFNICKQIFLHEIEIMRPKLIVALGNNVYSYLTTLSQDNINLFNESTIIKVPHPASILYTGSSVEGYRTMFKEIISHVQYN